MRKIIGLDLVFAVALFGIISITLVGILVVATVGLC